MSEALSAILLINLLGMLSPGPDMLMVLRHASQGRSQASWCCLGVLLGFSIHICLAIGGISLLVRQSPLLFEFIRYGGAAFLIFMGSKILFCQSRSFKLTSSTKQQPKTALLLSGLSCNLLNPKILIFVVSVFSQFIGAETQLSHKVIYGCALITETGLLWYVLVRILSLHQVQKKLQHYQHWVNRFSGSSLLGMGTLLGLHS